MLYIAICDDDRYMLETLKNLMLPGAENGGIKEGEETILWRLWK